MIIINKSGYLKFNKHKFRCALGKEGVGKKKTEGDNITPKGNYKIIDIYYRRDRIKKITSKIKLLKIYKNMGWCDDPTSKKYNRLILLPSKWGHEKLYREDHVYDLVIVLNYNMRPVIKNKGSAIFIHISKKNYAATKGCIALKKKDLLKLISIIDKNEEIKII